MTSYAIILLILCINGAITVVAPHIGLTVNGELIYATYETTAPGIFGIIEWVWDTGKFLFYLATFQIDGIPEILTIFFNIIQVMLIWIAVKLIRGGGD